MPIVTTSDELDIFYKDWGSGQPVVFSHGWPLNADAWDNQLKLVADNGYRAIAHDRRGHGRSTQTWSGNDMDTYAADLAALIDALDLRDVVLIAHSMGGGEVTRYMSRFGTDRVAKAVLIGAITPLMLKTDSNPKGTPIEAFDQIRAGLLADRSQFYKDLSVSFYGANREGNKISQGLKDQFWRLGMQSGLKPSFDCVKAFSETDFREEMANIRIPILVAHGDDDQIVPIDAAGRAAVEILPNATLKVYPGAPHGISADFEQALNADILEFLAS